MKWLCAGLLMLLVVLPVRAAEPLKADVLLQGGLLVDGTGSPGAIGDVAMEGGRIVGVGRLEQVDAKWTLNCNGLVICPGFIDLHNHADFQIVTAETRSGLNYLTQGCTTIVTGNCGFGPVDAAAYYSKIEQSGCGPNVAHLLPHGSLREDVMGSDLRAPANEELAKMRSLADKAMRDGVWGMTTGLIYVPGSFSKTDELIEVAKVVSQHGGIYASHIRNESRDLLGAVSEAITIGRDAQLPVHISHFKASGRDSWGTIRQAAALIEDARRKGQRVTADQYPYIASSTSLDATILPDWSLDGGRQAMLRRLDDPAEGPKVRAEIQKALERTANGEAIRIAGYNPRREWVGLNLKQIAEREQKPVLDIAETITRNGGARIVNFSMNEEDVRFAMAIDWVATASDGRAYLPGPDLPHPRSFGTFSRKIGYYALQEKVLSVEQAVRSASGLPAEILGLKDRGFLKTDQAADIAVFDPETFRDRATFDRPFLHSTGIRFLFVNGVPAIIDGEPTGALGGRPLRRKL